MSQVCPYCRESILSPDLVGCPACHTPHHHDCWQENGGCTIFGCENAPSDDPKLEISSQDIPPPSTPTLPGDAFYAWHDGQQRGPYSLEQLRQEVATGSLLESDLTWRQGMAKMTPISQVINLRQTTLPAPRSTIISRRSPQPRVPFKARNATRSPSQRSIAEEESDDPCEGRMHFGRLAYVLGMVGILFVTAVFAAFKETAAVAAPIAWILCLPIAVLRIRDVGMNGWMALLGYVPIANIFIVFRLLLAPRGYAITKKADTALHVMGWIFGILFVLVLLILLIGFLSQP